MANINLLPWREREHEERKKQFLITLGIVAAIAGVMVFAADRYMVGQIDNQTERNQYLTVQVAAVDKEISEIRQLQAQKRDLTERMAVIQDLQGKRPVIVRLFDELVRTLPDGVFYNNVTRTETDISIQGIAESNSRVSALMRGFEDSEWFAEPDLRQVTAVAGAVNAAGGQENGRNQFQLAVKIITPDLAAQDAQP